MKDDNDANIAVILFFCRGSHLYRTCNIQTGEKQESARSEKRN